MISKKILAVCAVFLGFVAGGCDDTDSSNTTGGSNQTLVIAFNDLGMHCMNHDFSEFMILPPFNTVHAVVIDRDFRPRLVSSGVEVKYSILNNTVSDTKTNFWDWVNTLLGVTLPANVGLTGNGLAGNMVFDAGSADWVATGIPVTPMDDQMNEITFNIGKVTALKNGAELASTVTVVPVSWEIRCDMCHAGPGQPVTDQPDQLVAHDLLHGTDLVGYWEGTGPVFCGSCHQQPELGALSPGLPGVSSLSRAMHNAHATRLGDLMMDNKCYGCHPGPQTQCLRDVHYAKGMTCTDCHGSMEDVANPARQPWVTLPRCEDCHSVAEHQYEQPGVLFRNSIGHGGLHCPVCHGSPHAVAPSTNPADNLQATLIQGKPGTLQKCDACHTVTPSAPFMHAPPQP